MPFSPAQFDELRKAIRLALASTRLTDWERTFLRDMQAKFDRQGTATNLSPKQYRLLMKMTRANSQRESRRGQRQRVWPLRTRTRSGFRSGNRRRDFRPTVGLVLVVFAVAFLVVFKGAERFPEYFGPVVSLISPREVVGTVTHVRDGDTIEVAGVPIRFGSLDCAESGTSAGDRATRRMRTLVAGQRLTCYLNGRTSYDRKIGSCRLSDGRDLASILIREDYCRRYW